jgi:hydrogenase maturation protease
MMTTTGTGTGTGKGTGTGTGTGTGVLVVGYGNSLRGDDGVGWRVAERLAEVDDVRLRGARVLARHQLTPELAADVAASRLAVFVDARVEGGVPGTVRTEWLGLRMRPTVPTACSHHVDIGEILGLADRLYGARPPAALVSIEAGRLDPGDGLSPAVAAAVPEAVAAVQRVVERAVADVPRHA